jgi:hypothetical protein
MSGKTRFLTGEICQETAHYAWDGYIDGSFSPFPTYKEQKIIIVNNTEFPAITSCEKKAYWKFHSAYVKPDVTNI